MVVSAPSALHHIIIVFDFRLSSREIIILFKVHETFYPLKCLIWCVLLINPKHLIRGLLAVLRQKMTVYLLLISHEVFNGFCLCTLIIKVLIFDPLSQTDYLWTIPSRFSSDPDTCMGLVQHEGGPCGVLATIQVHLFSYFITLLYFLGYLLFYFQLSYISHCMKALVLSKYFCGCILYMQELTHTMF